MLEIAQERDATKEELVYLIDASPKMFSTACSSEDQKDVTHFQIAIRCIAQSLKTQIINRSYDEVSICFFNTREKKNLQDLNGVYVFNVPEREDLDRPTARFIKEFDNIEESFSKEVGSKYGILSGSRDNSLYNALWVAQGLLRKGSAKTVDKRVLLFTNEDDPFGSIKGVTKMDMMRTTLQRAKDAQDLHISIEVLPLSRPGDEFNMPTFYAELLGMEENELAQFKALAEESSSSEAGKPFIAEEQMSIDKMMQNRCKPIRFGSTERSFICSDTGALLQEPPKLFQSYKNENIMFSASELSEIKRVATGHLRLLGFKPLSCLKDYHNLRPSTFVFPSDEEVIGSTCIFISIYRSMLKLNRFAVAFYGNPSRPQLVALVAQEEIRSTSGQVEPPGMHMIYLPFSDDIRPIEELHTEANPITARATDDQIKSVSSLVKRVDLRQFSVCQFANPALQRHYAVLQALALDEDDMPDIRDETLPDEEGMARPGIVKALEEFKLSVYGENYEENDVASGKTSEASKKRKAIADNASKEYVNYDWTDLADNGKLKELTVSELKYYLNVNNLPVTGKKEALISRILTHMGK
ncbi:hypothetical protein F511_36064 [Dorcoceras hygrometricum]|uniref:ATP-dependent DNA helicase 2 subunit KU70 n=1 Tax=Dorcoceras hygrometricum TaxID=472368 RepID=A0A2Z7D5L7_9LAMI|nr:hypothetical protein F511_36064 [Dorcoceras hygrometricum]